MKTISARVLTMTFISLTAASLCDAAPQKEPPSGLKITSVVEAGATKEYADPESVLLTNVFWAKAGSDVIVRTALRFLQLSDQPHVTAARDPNDRSPAPLPDCPDGETHSPCISGYTLDSSSVEVDIGLNADLPNPVDHYAINTINIIEGRDNPCKLMLWGNMVDPRFSKGQDQRLLAMFELDTCRSLTTHIGMNKVGFDPSQNRFIRELRVCNDSQATAADVLGPPLTGLPPTTFGRHGRLEIKGLAVRAGQVSSMNEHVTALDDSVSDTQPHCPDQGAYTGPGAGSRKGWHVWSTCPEGQVASGFTVYVTKGKAFSGMRIKCKYVRLLPGSAPVKDDRGY